MSLPAFLLLLIAIICLLVYALTRLDAYLEKDSRMMIAEVNRNTPAPLTRERLYEICEWVKSAQKPVLKISRGELWALVEMAKQAPEQPLTIPDFLRNPDNLEEERKTNA